MKTEKIIIEIEKLQTIKEIQEVKKYCDELIECRFNKYREG